MALFLSIRCGMQAKNARKQAEKPAWFLSDFNPKICELRLKILEENVLLLFYLCYDTRYFPDIGRLAGYYGTTLDSPLIYIHCHYVITYLYFWLEIDLICKN